MSIPDDALFRADVSIVFLYTFFKVFDYWIWCHYWQVQGFATLSINWSCFSFSILCLIFSSGNPFSFYLKSVQNKNLSLSESKTHFQKSFLWYWAKFYPNLYNFAVFRLVSQRTLLWMSMQVCIILFCNRIWVFRICSYRTLVGLISCGLMWFVLCILIVAVFVLCLFCIRYLSYF